MLKNEKDVAVMSLNLDSMNPRMPDERFGNFDEALEDLAVVGALDELVSSIAIAGWVDFEPLIVLEPTMEVIEGNRRLAALRIVRDPELAARLGIKLPQELHENAVPEEVRVWLVDDRRDARDFIGFKHINGPFKWDSFAKAKFAADWLDDGVDDVATVAQRLGDGHKTVARLVNGYRVLRQAEKLGFDRKAIPTRRFSFSHLYTALTRPNYREFLGLPDSTDLLPHDPVDEDHLDNLTKLMLFLYGQDDIEPVIRTQNPDLKRLADVLPHKVAVAMLETTPQDLDRVHSVVEDKSQIFEQAVFALDKSAKKAIELVGGYPGGDEELEEVVLTSSRTVRSILAAMRSASEDADD